MARVQSKPPGGTASMTDADPVFASSRWKTVLGYLSAFAMTAVVTIIAIGIDQTVTISNLSLLFVMPVVIAGVSFGFGPSLFAAVLGPLAHNYFLTDPRNSLAIADPANAWGIGLLFIVGLIVSGVAFTSRRRAIDATLLKRQATVLQGYSRDVVAADSDEAIISTTSRALAALFQVPVVVMLVAEGKVVSISKVGAVDLEEPDLEAVRSLFDTGVGSRAGVYPELASRFDFWPVKRAVRPNAVIGLAFDPDDRPAEPERVVDVVAAVLALALDRQHLRGGGDGQSAAHP